MPLDPFIVLAFRPYLYQRLLAYGGSKNSLQLLEKKATAICANMLVLLINGALMSSLPQRWQHFLQHWHSLEQ